MRGLLVLFFITSLPSTKLVSAAEFDASVMRQILQQKGASKAFHYLLGDGGSLTGVRYDRMDSFYLLLEAQDKETAAFVEELYAKRDANFLKSKLAREWSSIAFKHVKNPESVFSFWKEGTMDAQCNWSIWHWDGESQFDITGPKAISDFLDRKGKVAKLSDDKFGSLKAQCLKQVDLLIEKEVVNLTSKGFSFDENNKFLRQFSKENDWVSFPKLRASEEAGQFKEGDYDTLSPSLRFQKRMQFFEKIAQANVQWLENYLIFEQRFFSKNNKLQLYNFLGQAITKDPEVVLSFFKEEFSKGDNLKNVCGNTYEDLLWGVAVEEQVISAAVEKLEARKKSLCNMKDESLSDMKNQCIQAVDNSLAIWKGRAQ